MVRTHIHVERASPAVENTWTERRAGVETEDDQEGTAAAGAWKAAQEVSQGQEHRRDAGAPGEQRWLEPDA
jgi:hypothetical protein